ncbi:MAG: LysM peptidoglycan-binding domain-containing protein [Candidatus Nanoarchaeia archaeon]
MFKSNIFSLMRFIISAIMTVSLCVLLTSCGNKLDEAKHPLFIKAKKHAEQHEYENAIKTFKEYLQINPSSSKTHYELAMLYDDQLDDPLNAIYHFKEYIALATDSQDKENAKLWLENSEKKYFEKLKERFSSETDLKKEIEFLKARESELLANIEKLDKENKALKGTSEKQTATATQAIAQTPNTTSAKENLPSNNATTNPLAPTPIVQKPQAPQQTKATTVAVKTYRVQQGDTLSKISKKFYGDSKYHSMIFEANRDKMKSPTDLKLGEEIKIPPVPQKKN